MSDDVVHVAIMRLALRELGASFVVYSAKLSLASSFLSRPLRRAASVQEDACVILP
jgi:hypothetical protein